MWLKEEFIGLEECFRITAKVMEPFCLAKLQGRDFSIEQYLLNFWVKDLSLRDTVDRIQVCSRNSDEVHEFFKILFNWFIQGKL